jgi:hypothetical protein
MLSEGFSKRIAKLAGINEGVTLKADSGRSEEYTLAWFSEEYLLRVAGEVISELDQEMKNRNLSLSISKGNTKMYEDSLVTKFIIEGNVNNLEIKQEVIFTISVNLENGGHTIATSTIEGATTKTTLTSKHSQSDIQSFKRDVIDNLINTVILSEKK